jgi:putative sigma-54 modulation protein
VQVKVSARHGHLTDELTAAITEKAEKLLHYFERVSQIDVILDLRGDSKKAEVLVDCEHKHDLVAHAEAEDVLVAVAAAVDKVKAQVKHYKEKLQDHRRDPSHGGTEGIKH